MNLGNGLLGIYEKSLPEILSLEEKIALFKKAEYDFFELSIDESEERLKRIYWNDSMICHFQQMLKDQQFAAYSICLSGLRKYPLGHQDSRMRKECLKVITKTVDLAIKLGIRVILIPAYDVYYEDSTEDTRSYFIETMAAAVQYAGKRGITLALENIEKPFADSVEKTMGLIRTLRSPYLQCYVDPGNMVASGVKDPVGQVHLAKGHIAAFHLKDGRPGEYKSVLYGSGILNFKDLFKCLIDDHAYCLYTAEVNTLSDVDSSFENILEVRCFLNMQYERAKEEISKCNIPEERE